MIQSQHCNLCKHENRSLKNGLTCGLTKKRPDFKETCSNFNLSYAAKRNYKYIITEFEIIKKQKKAIHLKFYLLIIIGFGIVLFGNIFLERLNNLSVFALYVVYFFYGFGLLILVTAYSILNKHKREFKNFESKKHKVEFILEQYQIELVI
jgi:hypothetical protein